MLRSLLLAVMVVLSTAPFAVERSAETAVRLYALDCGRLEFPDLGVFADTGEYDGHAQTLMASCFLIRHPQGDLLWDAGMGDAYADLPDGKKTPLYTVRVPIKLGAQLQRIGIDWDDIDYFAFSHGHADHLGNAPALKKATWLMNRKEEAWLNAEPAPERTRPELIAGARTARKIMLDGDHDVFGDGSIRILSAPGHTPGHQVLMVKLQRSGTVVLSGDLYHTRENRADRRMPVFNISRAETLAAFDRIERMLVGHGARMVIQHSLDDFRSLPQVPEYLD